MKFTNGFWLIRPEFIPSYPVEYSMHELNGNNLILYASSKHISTRGDMLNIPVFTITLSSPMRDVIKVSMCHFKGAPYKKPFFEIYSEEAAVDIYENNQTITYKSGNIKAEICKEPNKWGIRFIGPQGELTNTGFRNMGYMKNRITGEAFILEQLAIDVGEYIYGLGERFTPFVKNGQVVDMWNEDGGTASEIAYKNIPFYMTNKGYGVFVDNAGDVSFEVASEKVERVQFSAKSERLDYYIINGPSPKDVVRKYTTLTGRPALPPAWSFGLWLTTSFTTSYDEDTVTGFIQGMADRDIPLHVFHFDCFWMKGYQWCDFKWDDEVFPDPAGMLKRYKERGLKICVWINPYIAQKSYLFDEGMEKGYLVKTKDGGVWQTDMWQPGMALVDFTSEDACKWYQSKLEELLDMGVDCFKTDFGERIPVRDIVYNDESDPLKMHNYYTFLFNRTVFELLERKKGVGKATVFARSATAGSQQFPVHWGGDSTASYPSMAETLRGGLSLSLCGFGFWSHDIGGFERTASADLYKRWCAFGMLSSHSRLHGSDSYRVPWAFDEEASVVLRKFVKLKCKLMPYLYSQAVKAHTEGIPMLRPMFMEFPEDRACETLDMQYMLGDSLLIAPVMKENGKVNYYLPAGRWTNYLTGEVINGERFSKEVHDYMSLPLMVRPNSVIAAGACDSRPDYDYFDGITFELFEIEDGAKVITTVPDLQGKTVLTAVTARKGNTITVSLKGKFTDWYVRVHSNGKVQRIRGVSDSISFNLNTI
jgi:alpha-D-xyloside xylohydrolase